MQRPQPLHSSVLNVSFAEVPLTAPVRNEAPGEEPKTEKYVELASICTDPRCEGKGIGTELINHLKIITNFEEYAYINLETDAENNEKANIFYEKNGFKLVRQYTTAEGRVMNEYRFCPEGI